MKQLVITVVLLSFLTFSAFSQTKKDQEIIDIAKKAVEAQQKIRQLSKRFTLRTI